MPTSLASRVQDLTRLDLQRLSNRPGTSRIVLAGLVSVAASVLACVILVAIGKAAFTDGGSFGPFHFGTYAPLAILGVIGATIGWAILVQASSQPRWVLGRAAVAVTVILLIPDFLLLPTNPTGPVVTLMAMHLAIAVLTYGALLLVAPATGSVCAGRFLPTWQPTRS
jgi:Family of unknown function (DUF6069)